MNGKIMRWYYGDPLFDIGAELRYVEFNQADRVTFVREFGQFNKVEIYQP